MGLDQYLNIELQIPDFDRLPKSMQTLEARSIADSVASILDTYKIPSPTGIISRRTHLIVSAAYWRKCNQIHAWFEARHGSNIENCQEVRFEIDDIKDLLADCKQVLADHDLAPELLPTTGGFFFGSTDYGPYYFEDLSETVRMLEPYCNLSCDVSFIYHGWW